jgi:hypothetical protein
MVELFAALMLKKKRESVITQRQDELSYLPQMFAK